MNKINKINLINNLKKIKEKFVVLANKIKNLHKLQKTQDEKEVEKNQNELARIAQNKAAFFVAAGFGALIFTGWFFMHPKGTEVAKKSDISQEKVQMDGTADAQFTQDSSQKALEEQQQEIKSLNEKLTEIGNQMELLQKSLDEKDQEELNNNKVAIDELQTKITELEKEIKKPGSLSSSHTGIESNIENIRTTSITTTNFSYPSGDRKQVTSSARESTKEATLGSNTDSNAYSSINLNTNSNIKAKTDKNYVPPGTFAKAVLLSGADTNAGVHGQTDTTPIVMRILDNGTLPNGKRSSLKGCFVTAAAYGDASSERGQIRLQHLSCIRPGNHILDIPIEGTINDMGGNDGIRGHVVMRNHKLIWNAGISGFLSGIGNAMQQSATTQAISPLGFTSTVKSGKVFEHSAYGGANTALGKLADYYIKLADMYHPIVQVHAGSQVNVVFLKGFSLTEGIPEQDVSVSEKDTKTEITNSQETGSSDVMKTIKNSHLGQPITENEINNSHEELE